MRAVAVRAIRLELPVRSLALFSVAGAAGRGTRRTAVGLVTTIALLVTLWCCPLLDLMTVLALLDLSAAVRLVTVGACGVAGVGPGLFGLVASGAPLHQCFGAVGQTLVAAGAHSMPGQCRGALCFLGMAACAQRRSLTGEQEIVRGVALSTTDPLVPVAVMSGLLMARCAVSDPVVRRSGRRVRVVTTGACAGLAVLWVVGLDIGVALGACLRRGGLHVVW